MLVLVLWLIIASAAARLSCARRLLSRGAQRALAPEVREKKAQLWFKRLQTWFCESHIRSLNLSGACSLPPGRAKTAEEECESDPFPSSGGSLRSVIPALLQAGPLLFEPSVKSLSRQCLSAGRAGERWALGGKRAS